MAAPSRSNPEPRGADLVRPRAVEPPAPAPEPARAATPAPPARPTPAASAQAALGNAAVLRRMRRAQAARPEAPAEEGAPAPEAPAPEGEAPAPEAPAERRAAPATAELLMPEPPAGLTEEDRARLSRVEHNATEAAAAEATMPPAEENVREAREAVTEPSAETAARAQAAVVDVLDERPPPSPEIEELCERIYAVIRSKRPPDEESLVQAKPDEMASEAGGELGTTVQQRTEDVQASYDAMQQPAEGQPLQQPQSMETPPESVESPELGAQAAAPSPVPAESVSLDADVAANEARMREAGMDSEAASLVQSGPIAEAREAQGALSELAARDPALVLAEQAEAIARAGEDMAALQARAVAALDSARASTASGVAGRQTDMVGSEEQLRASAATLMQGHFQSAREQVQLLLEPLPRTAMARWTTGVDALSTAFKTRLKKVEDWIEERHGGGWGVVVSAWDWLTGLPDWVTEEYDAAEKAFGDGTCVLIRDISRDVNAVIATCEGLIETARERIDEVVQGLPESLQEWAAGEQTRLGEQLDGLKAQATETRDTFNRDLVERASSAVQEVRQEVHGLRQAAGGLVGRIADAVNRFVEDPARFIIDGLLELVGISPAAFWAVVERIQSVIDGIADDPLGFASNLLAALGQGFQQFFNNIGTHLLQGMLSWLFSKLGEVGVTLPPDLSLKSVITLILQVMGITWARIRRLLAKHIGEENVALIERAWEVVSALLVQGPAGLFELLKDKFDPRMILDQVLEAAMRYVTEAVITRVAARILLLFNPVGAIVQAIEAIYRVLKWVFQNASRIFSLVETVVNGAAALLAGDTGGMANAVEQALARLVGPVLAFIADYAGLGGIPEALKDAILGLQGWVEGILDRVIGWLAEQGRRLLRAVGLGGTREPGAPERGDTELGETVRFRAGGEAHRVWVDVQGTEATVMLASTPMPLEERLTNWNGRLGTLNNETPVPGASHGQPPRQRATTLLLRADMLLRAANTTADTLARQSQAATASPAAAPPQPVNDDPLEAKEHELVDAVQELFLLFGDTPDQDAFVEVPRRVSVNKVRIPKEHISEELSKDLGKGSAGNIHSGGKLDARVLVQTLTSGFGATYNRDDKHLALRPADALMLGAEPSLSRLGTVASTQTGAPKIALKKEGKMFTVSGDLELGTATRANLDIAFGESRAALEEAEVVRLANERLAALMTKWQADVVDSGVTDGSVTPAIEVWKGFTIDRTQAEQPALDFVKQYAVEEHVSTVEALASDLRGKAKARFQDAAGKLVAEQARAYALARAKDAALQDKLKDKDKVKYETNEQLGRIVTPASSAPEHHEFEPVVVHTSAPVNNIITVTYVTRKGQSFTLQVNALTGLTLSIDGTNLSLKGPGDPKNRGITEDSPYYVTNQALNRSHLIADEFKGSGYASALNLITTSDYYNQTVMRGAERDIGRFINASNAITFRMTVKVTWGEVLDQTLLQRIVATDWYKNNYKNAADPAGLEAELKAKLALSPKLKRCMRVEYTAVITDAEDAALVGTDFYTKIDEDAWLLLDKNA